MNEFLEPFELSSFQNRFVTKILLFIAKNGTIKAAPIVLKKQIQLKESIGAKLINKLIIFKLL